MADVFSKEKRSEVMSSIRSRGNKNTEIVFMDLLRRHRISGWRRHRKISMGAPSFRKSDARRQSHVRPDFVFPTLKLAVFVDGCFWHSCPKHAASPASNTGFWNEKLEYNRRHDRYVTRMLRKNGWVVVRIWEHDLPSTRVVGRIRRAVIRCEQIKGGKFSSLGIESKD